MSDFFDRPRHIHFVGIKGVAMTALAVYMKERGKIVTGSDIEEEFPTDAILAKRGIVPSSGFSPDHIESPSLPDMVIYTGAHGGRTNIEVKAAERLGLPVMPHGIALGRAMEGKRQIVVSGSHGKTTTSAMIAMILTAGGTDPSYGVGCGGIKGLPASGHFGRGPWFVAEGDEYVTDPGHDLTPRFLWTTPEILVVTNIDFDHPDVYADLASVQHAFSKLQKDQRGMKLTVVNADDPPSRVLLNGPNVVTYGFSSEAQIRIASVTSKDQQSSFVLERGGKLFGEFTILVPGRHNVLNATAAVLAATGAGLAISSIRKGLSAFEGTKRRFEFFGTRKGVMYYDDYAHHPKEIRATLSAARDWFAGRRVIAVFQPHTYSRTKSLMDDFARAFSDAAILIVTEIYASARERETLGITGKTLAHAAAKHHTDVHFARGAEDVRTLLGRLASAGDVVLCMGAGDIYSWEKGFI